MSRAVLLLILSVAIPATAQEAPQKGTSAVTIADADLGSAGLRLAESQTTATAGSIPAVGASSSNAIAGTETNPALLPAARTAVMQPVIATSTPKLREKPSVKQQRAWWALTAVQHGAATFDAWSTRKSLESGNGYERNPLLKPFAGSVAIYPVIQIAPLGLDYLSKSMMQSRHGVLRKTWWLPQTIATAGFVWSGAHNLRVSNRR